LRGLGGDRLVHKGANLKLAIRMISALKAYKLSNVGCDGYLCNVVDSAVTEQLIENISMVCEYLDVFPKEIPGMPPLREVNFCIDLVLRAIPISKAA